MTTDRSTKIVRVPAELAAQVEAYKESHGCTLAEASRAVFAGGREALESLTKMRSELQALNARLDRIEKAKATKPKASTEDKRLATEMKALQKGLTQQGERLSGMIAAWNG